MLYMQVMRLVITIVTAVRLHGRNSQAGLEGRRAPEGMFELRWRDAGSFIKSFPTHGPSSFMPAGRSWVSVGCLPVSR